MFEVLISPHPPCFSELVETKGLILAGVQKTPKTIEGGIENKGVRGRRDSDFWQVLEVAVNKEVRGILGWAGVWDDAVRLTEGVVLTTCKSYHMRYVTVNQNRKGRRADPVFMNQTRKRKAASPAYSQNVAHPPKGVFHLRR